MPKKQRVAVIGSGINGLVTAYMVAKEGIEVVLYEKEDSLGGHSCRTVHFHGIDIDLGFMLSHLGNYAETMELFYSLGMDMKACKMTFSVSIDKGQGFEWGTHHGFPSLFAQKKNMFNPHFWQMFKEIMKFKDDAISYLEVVQKNSDIVGNETLGQFVKSRGYSQFFQEACLVPICSSIWSCQSEDVMSFSAFSVLSFVLNHQLLQLFTHWQGSSIRWYSQCGTKVGEELENRGCHIRTSCEVKSVLNAEQGCVVTCKDGSEEMFDECVLAIHAPDAVRLLGNQVTFDELRALGAFQYEYRDVFLHHDKNFMPRNPAAWSALNFLRSIENKSCVTYWLNVLQDIGETSLPFLVTLSPNHIPEGTLLRWSTAYAIPSVAALKASLEFDKIQGKRGIWFCGPYHGSGFHEGALKAGMTTAHSMLGKNYSVRSNPKLMVPSLVETGARFYVMRFLKNFISTGCIILMEEGGEVFTFQGTGNKCSLKTALRVHNPQFYWKIMMRADMGLADAYINGDFSFIDDEGLLNLLMILVANRDSNLSASKANKNSLRGWWTSVLFTASLATARYSFKHFLRKNSLTQARRNVSSHYDLSNELFALYLDETMTYSCPIFKEEDEDLKVAQLRKISHLIEKARIGKNHEVLEIGCGWGSLAIEIVKQTGCKYTGITLSEEQLKLAEMRVKEAGLQDRIRFLICDYRQLPVTYKYDRIISCEMIEHVGHDYYEDFFRICESVLVDDGLFVLQYTSTPDDRYEEFRNSSDFIKEYIFPGGHQPSLSRLTSAMAAASRLCVEHLENIGSHYTKALRCWRKNFLDRRSEVLALGFDERFIRMWEYYFDFYATAFRSHIFRVYQIVFSRSGNIAEFGSPTY